MPGNIKAAQFLRAFDIRNNKANIDSDGVVSSASKSSNLGGSTTYYTNVSDLPISAPAFSKALVTSTNTLYQYNGGWYPIALINNFSPVFSVTPNASYTLNNDGSATTVTVLAQDSDDVPIAYNVVTDSDFDAFATITHDSEKHNVWTVTPTASSGSFPAGTVTFRASDGVNLASVNSEFSISFEADWTGGFTLVSNYDENSASVNAAFGEYTMDITPDGTRLMVCAREDDDANGDNIGAVYIYTTTDNWANWTLEQKLQQSGVSMGGVPHIYHGAQGAAISDDGNWIVVGASRYGEGYPFNLTGRVYLWQRSGTTWTQHSSFGSPSGMNYYFGDGAFDFSADASVMAIGHYSNSTNNKGQVYFYTRSGSTWTYRGVEYGRSIQNQTGYFGQGVKVSEDGNWVFVGEYNYWNGSVQAGQIHVYLRSGNTWAYSHSISAGSSQYEIGKNFSLNSDATRIAVGAPEYNDGNDSGVPGNLEGAVLVYTRTDANATSWTLRATLRNQIFQDYGAPIQGQMGNTNLHMTRDGKFILVAADRYAYGGMDIWKDTSSGSDGTVWTKQSGITGEDLGLTKGISKATAFTADAKRVFTTVGDNAQLGSVARGYVKVFRPT